VKRSIGFVIKFFGTQRELARVLGVTDGAVSHWVSKGRLPPHQAIHIERITRGAIRAVDLAGVSQ